MASYYTIENPDEYPDKTLARNLFRALGTGARYKTYIDDPSIEYSRNMTTGMAILCIRDGILEEVMTLISESKLLEQYLDGEDWVLILLLDWKIGTYNKKRINFTEELIQDIDQAPETDNQPSRGIKVHRYLTGEVYDEFPTQETYRDMRMPKPRSHFKLVLHAYLSLMSNIPKFEFVSQHRERMKLFFETDKINGVNAGGTISSPIMLTINSESYMVCENFLSYRYSPSPPDFEGLTGIEDLQYISNGNLVRKYLVMDHYAGRQDLMEICWEIDQGGMNSVPNYGSKFSSAKSPDVTSPQLLFSQIDTTGLESNIYWSDITTLDDVGDDSSLYMANFLTTQHLNGDFTFQSSYDKYISILGADEIIEKVGAGGVIDMVTRYYEYVKNGLNIGGTQLEKENASFLSPEADSIRESILLEGKQLDVPLVSIDLDTGIPCMITFDNFVETLMLYNNQFLAPLTITLTMQAYGIRNVQMSHDMHVNNIDKYIVRLLPRDLPYFIARCNRINWMIQKQILREKINVYDSDEDNSENER